MFKVGEKYCFRNAFGWLKFVAFVPEAMEYEQAVFVDNTGQIVTRSPTGACNSSFIKDRDAMLIIYEG